VKSAFWKGLKVLTEIKMTQQAVEVLWEEHYIRMTWLSVVPGPLRGTNQRKELKQCLTYTTAFYDLDFKCLPKVHGSKAWSSMMVLQGGVVEPLGGRT
jgi:hypothetical protein